MSTAGKLTPEERSAPSDPPMEPKLDTRVTCGAW